MLDIISMLDERCPNNLIVAPKMQVGLLARLENWLLLGGAGFCPIGGTGAPSSFRCWNVPGVAGVDALDMAACAVKRASPCQHGVPWKGLRLVDIGVPRETGPERKAVSDSENV